MRCQVSRIAESWFFGWLLQNTAMNRWRKAIPSWSMNSLSNGVCDNENCPFRAHCHQVYPCKNFPACGTAMRPCYFKGSGYCVNCDMHADGLILLFEETEPALRCHLRRCWCSNTFVRFTFPDSSIHYLPVCARQVVTADAVRDLPGDSLDWCRFVDAHSKYDPTSVCVLWRKAAEP